MLVAIHQPNLLPRAKTVDKLLAADMVIYLDDVQYVPREWQNRARIRRRDGALHWLTVPVVSKGRGRQILADCQIDDSTRWRYKHLETLRHAYGHSQWWPRFDELIAPLWSSRHERLAPFAFESMERVVRSVGGELDTVLASELEACGRRTEHLTELCLAVGASGYLSGSGGMTYLDVEYMKRRGLRVFRQVEPEVRQQDWSELSILDPLLREGLAATASTLLGSGHEEV